jgi:hypothetical protein
LLIGPFEGRNGDWELFKDSGIESMFCSLFSDCDSSQWLYIYGDRAYYEGLGVMGVYRARRGFSLTQQ